MGGIQVNMNERLSVEKRLALTSFRIFDKPHIIVNYEKCEGCGMPCIRSCPAGLYSLDEKGKLKFNYEGCLECGTCRLVCPRNAISWDYPPGGFGVWFKLG